MRWFKRLLLAVALLLLIGLLVMAGGWWQLHGTPDWYPTELSAEARSAAAQRAENQWINAQNQIAAAHARQLQVHDSTDPAATQRALEENRRIQISFSADELNAFFQKWSRTSGWDKKMSAYLSNPQVVLYQGRLILAGEVKDLPVLPDMKMSIHFEPRITGDGRLDLHLVRTMGGKAPLPEGLWDSQKQKLTDVMSRRLPAMQQGARISEDGDANGDAIAAAMGKLLLQMLNHQPGEAVVFIPLSAGGVMNRQVPVQVTEIQIKPLADNQPERLTLTVAPMTADQRETFLQRIRDPYSTATAMSK